MRTFRSRVIFGATICTIRTRCISWDLCKLKRNKTVAIIWCATQSVVCDLSRKHVIFFRHSLTICVVCNVGFYKFTSRVAVAFISYISVWKCSTFLHKTHTPRERPNESSLNARCATLLMQLKVKTHSLLFNFSTADSLRHRFYFCAFFFSLRIQLTVRERELTIEIWENILHSVEIKTENNMKNPCQ